MQQRKNKIITIKPKMVEKYDILGITKKARVS